jgi:hypothetical protein
VQPDRATVGRPGLGPVGVKIAGTKPAATRRPQSVLHPRKGGSRTSPGIVNRAGAGETVRVQDDMFIHQDGHQIPVAYTASPFRTDHGAQGCVVAFTDISERKAREQALLRDAETLSWIGRIQNTLAEDRFLLYAQPIIDIGTMQVVQHELLLRVREPDGTIIGPGRYLQIAEQYGLIDDIDRWVIRHAMTIAATGLPVQVNISARSVVDPTMLDQIERWIQRHHADKADRVRDHRNRPDGRRNWRPTVRATSARPRWLRPSEVKSRGAKLCRRSLLRCGRHTKCGLSTADDQPGPSGRAFDGVRGL